MPKLYAKEKLKEARIPALERINTAPSFADRLAAEEAAVEVRNRNNPNFKKPLYSGEMGPISKWLYPQAQAMTGPLGTVFYNPERIAKDKAQLSDIVPHEMAHVSQGPLAVLKSMFSPTARDKYEYAAINTEPTANPKIRRTTDINLPIDTRPTKKAYPRYVGARVKRYLEAD